MKTSNDHATQQFSDCPVQHQSSVHGRLNVLQVQFSLAQSLLQEQCFSSLQALEAFGKVVQIG